MLIKIKKNKAQFLCNKFFLRFSLKLYQIKELAHADALKLFSECAFGRDHPDANYIELTVHEALKYAHGDPLALRVLGRLLFGKRKEV